MRRLSNIGRLLAIVLLSTPFSFAASPPTAESIQQIIAAANTEWQKFENETFVPRMQFELSGRLLSEQSKTFFCELAANARNEIDLVEKQQRAMLEQIEQYQGADWEEIFGSTGLWRQLAASVERTKLNKAQIDYFRATVCEDSQNQKALEEILSELNRPDASKMPSSADILTAKILCALTRTDEKYRQPAEQQFSKLRLRSNRSWCESLKASMEQVKCLGPSGPNELNNLAQALAKSECKDDREMLLSLAILQRKYSPDELQNTLFQSPQIAMLLGKLILADLSSRFSQPPEDVNLESIGPADAELAATIALQTDPQPYANLITKLAANDRFQAPAVVYVAANQLNQTSPQKAAELLIKASNLQLEHPNILLKVTPEEMAKQAFDLAYRAFTESPSDCQPAIDAFQNYSRIAPDKIDEQTQFLYANLLNHCNRTSEAVEMFSRLANRSQFFWHDAAVLELLKIELNKATTPAVLTHLHDFILGCTRPEEREAQIKGEAINLYCQLLLNQESNDSACGEPCRAAEQVLQILDAAEPTPGFPYDLFRAQAMKQLGRLEESAHFMSQAIDANDVSMAPQSISLLSEVLDKIELLEQNARDFNQMLLDCNTLAEFAYKCQNNRQTTLSLAEVLILRADLDGAQTLLNSSIDKDNINWMRAQARLLMARGDFNQASLLWAKIAEIRRNDTAKPNQKSYNWWQAKFYELDCLSKVPSTSFVDLRHAIEVLQNSYAEMPSPWAEKLNGLKERLQNSD